MKVLKEIFKVDLDTNRIYGLDILRAFAILFVLIGHAVYLAPASTHQIHKWLNFDGVLLFFVLSGYLIGGIIIRDFKQNITFGKLLYFWKRRWLRTLPAFYFVLIVLVFAHSIFDIKDQNKWDVFLHFVFLQNFWEPHSSIFPVAWSLSVEEWFYMLVPLLTYLLISNFNLPSKRSVLMVIVLVIIVPLAIRVHNYWNISSVTTTIWDSNFRKLVPLRLDSIMFGVLGAYIKTYHSRWWNYNSRRVFFIGLVALIVLHMCELLQILYLTGFYGCVLSFSVKSFCTLMLLPYLSTQKSSTGRIYALVSVLSIISYSVYLLHFSVVQELFIKHIPNEIGGINVEIMILDITVLTMPPFSVELCQ